MWRGLGSRPRCARSRPGGRRRRGRRDAALRRAPGPPEGRALARLVGGRRHADEGVVGHDGDLGADEALDVAEGAALLGVAERDRDARGARARRAADAVHVALGLVGEIEVDDVGDAVDVDAARRDVGRDEDADAAALEGVERALARALRLVAVDGGRGDALAVELLGDAVRAVLRAREHEDARHRRVAQDLSSRARLWPRSTKSTDWSTFSAVDETGVTATLHGVDEDLVGELLDLVGHRRREQEGLPLPRQRAARCGAWLDEAHVEHAVGLVEDEDLDGVEVREALLHEIEQAAGRRDEDVGAAAERLDLRAWPTPPKITALLGATWRP